MSLSGKNYGDLLHRATIVKTYLIELLKRCLENPGIDPGTSHMQSERSTIWANPPSFSQNYDPHCS